MTVEKLSCKERDTILLDPRTGLVASEWGIASSLTDAYGEFGEPRIETTWEADGVQVQDIRHPYEGSYSAPDRMPCEHYRLTGKDKN